MLSSSNTINLNQNKAHWETYKRLLHKKFLKQQNNTNAHKCYIVIKVIVLITNYVKKWITKKIQVSKQTLALAHRLNSALCSCSRHKAAI